MKAFKPKLLLGLVAVAAIGSAGPALAAPDPDTAFILNTFLFLVGGFLVMWMAAGFCMLEAGFVRTPHVATICLKNIGLYSVAGIMYYLIGYQLMYNGVDGGFFGIPGIWGPSELASDEAIDISTGYAAASDWFFQMVFVATAASIVSGCVAERPKLIPFLIFVAVLTGVIYPIQGAWQWGGGWLSEMGFSDFAGSTIVHSCGGWAALAGLLLVGARVGKYDEAGNPVNLPASSVPLATLGTFILWLGWFGFNGASQLALGSVADSVAVSQIFANTNMAAAGGVVAAIILVKILHGKVNIGYPLNGALAGLVSITAEPLTPSIGEAIIIGGIGACIAIFAMMLLEKLKLDDVVGAIPVHLFAGIWGTIIVPFTNDGTSYVTQAIGIVAIGAFVFIASFITWLVIKVTMGIRMTRDDELVGGDLTEMGHEAYPQFLRA